MIEGIKKEPIPEWLSKLTKDEVEKNPIPIPELLKNSVYYPACHLDGEPVHYLLGNAHSFVYADYGVTKESISKAVIEKGFTGYSVFASQFTDTQKYVIDVGYEAPKYVNEKYKSREDDGFIKPFFCCWFIFERNEGKTDEHGPKRFSLIYFCMDGVLLFDALYLKNNVAPLAVTVIQSDGFSGNWTSFRDDREIFARLVLRNPAGKPEFLLYGGIGSSEGYQQPCWSTYGKQVAFIKKGNSNRWGVWALS